MRLRYQYILQVYVYRLGDAEGEWLSVRTIRRAGVSFLALCASAASATKRDGRGRRVVALRNREPLATFEFNAEKEFCTKLTRLGNRLRDLELKEREETREE